MMIKTKNKDAEQITRLLQAKVGELTEQFIQWQSWTAMVEGRNTNLVKMQ
jgi:hypothetical protein